MLEITSLSKSYRKKVILEDISITIHPGEIIGLVGENGAGKSTFLSILATLMKPTSGAISLNGIDYNNNIKKIRKCIGYVPQDIAIWEDFTVEENMKFFENISWVTKNNNELQELCSKMNLNKWKEPVRTLSGGMKRKLNLAISMIHEPELLLLDEPTVGIDLKSKKEIGLFLKELVRTKKRMIIYTSHDMDEIKTLCDRIICIGNDPFYANLLEDTNKEMCIF